MDIISLCKNKDNIISFAKDRLSDDHQRIFAEHFMLSFINTEDQFPILGENAMKWLGYEAKNKFKEFVVKNLNENEYIILLNQKVDILNPSHNFIFEKIL
jgi:hypothetical protein